MTKGLDEFLTITSIFQNGYVFHSKAKHTGLLRIAMEEITSNVIEPSLFPPIMLTLNSQSCVVCLGHLGKYRIQATPDNLNTFAQRLYQVSHSKRFVKAILGYWPA